MYIPVDLVIPLKGIYTKVISRNLVKVFMYEDIHQSNNREKLETCF